MSMKDNFIADSASLGKNVIIGKGCIIKENVKISDYCIIYDNVIIEENTFIGPFSIIGEPTYSYYDYDNGYIFSETRIGSNSIIRSHSVIYSDVLIGKNFQTGHKVVIREKSIIGENCRIGTSSDIQGYCSIGNYVSLHSSVIIGQKSKIDDFVWIFPNVVLTNDPNPPSNELYGITIKKYAVIATGSIILPGIEIGENAVVGAFSLVKKDVPSGMLVVGYPAKEICPANKIIDRKTHKKAYPWPLNFDRGMPWSGIGFDKWSKNQKGR